MGYSTRLDFVAWLRKHGKTYTWYKAQSEKTRADIYNEYVATCQKET